MPLEAFCGQCRTATPHEADRCQHCGRRLPHVCPEGWPPPPHCAYCMAAVATCVCPREHHSGWGGEPLCTRCYVAVLQDPPVLPGAGMLDLDPLAPGDTL